SRPRTRRSAGCGLRYAACPWAFSRCCSSDDENVLAATHDFILAQLQLAIADALAGADVVLVAVPGTDEVQLVGEFLALVGLVRRDEVFHAGDDVACAGLASSLLVVVAVGVVGAGLRESVASVS